MQKAEKLLRSFYLISGMRVALYDRQYRCVAWAGPTAYSYCNAVHTSSAGLERCFHSDINAFEAVEKTRKTHTFTCPFGLFEAIAPILEGSEITGYLFVGEAILQDSAAKAAALQEARRFVGEGMPQERIHRLIESLACHDAPTLAALVDTLELFAVRLADEQIFDLDKQEVAALTKAYVSQNYHKKLTLSELALHFHCSTVTLTEHFRAAYGTSIMAYVADMRMQKARDLLQNTSLSVGTVAERCGFESIEHFSKMFKRMHEKSPANWRKCQKKEHP